MKRLQFVGSSYDDLLDFPADARRRAGFELRLIQAGEPPSDCKPMPSIGGGVIELRVWVRSGTFRVIYVANVHDAVHVLHVFQKKTQQTTQRDLEIARERYRFIVKS